MYSFLKRFLVLLLVCNPLCVSGQDIDIKENSNPIEPYKKNYLAFPFRANSDGDNEARVQFSFLAMFKAKEFEVGDKLFLNSLESRKVLNVGFTYTQHLYDDIADSSFPVVSTDYFPGLFASIHDRDTSNSLVKQFLFGWEHQSNGEYEGQRNRGVDRIFVETLFGFGSDFRHYTRSQNYQESQLALDSSKRQNIKFSRMGSDEYNLRLRASHSLNISNENKNIDEFYGVLELEGTYRTQYTETGVTISRGTEKGSVMLEFGTKYIPGFDKINPAWKEKCDSIIDKKILQGIGCSIRYILAAPFDLKNNHGAWFLQYYNGYGDRIRDYDQRINNEVRFGFRFKL